MSDNSINLEAGDIGAALRELAASSPEVYEIICEVVEAIVGREMHDIRHASLARRMRAQLRGRPGAGALVDEFVAALRRGVS